MKKKKNNKAEFIKAIGVKNQKEQLKLDEMMLAARFIHEMDKIKVTRNLKLKDLAEKIGVSRSYMTQIFQGNKIPSLEFLARAQKALDIQFAISSKSHDKNSSTKRPISTWSTSEIPYATMSEVPYFDMKELAHGLEISTQNEAVVIPLIVPKDKLTEKQQWGNTNNSLS